MSALADKPTIGIVAGSGPEAGLDLWAKVLRANRRRLGTSYTGDVDAPPVHIISKPTLGLSVDPFAKDNQERVWDELRAALLHLDDAVDVIAIACNTLYSYQRRIDELGLQATLVSPVACLGDFLSARGEHAVGLLGSRLVRDIDGGPPYAALADHFKVELTAEEEVLERLLAGLKMAGQSTQELQWDFETVLSGMNSEVIALACTELPLLAAPDAIDIELVDVTELVAERLVAASVDPPLRR